MLMPLMMIDSGGIEDDRKSGDILKAEFFFFAF